MLSTLYVDLTCECLARVQPCGCIRSSGRKETQVSESNTPSVDRSTPWSEVSLCSPTVLRNVFSTGGGGQNLQFHWFLRFVQKISLVQVSTLTFAVFVCITITFEWLSSLKCTVSRLSRLPLHFHFACAVDGRVLGACVIPC